MNYTNQPKMPRWVKISGLAIIILVIAFIVYHLTGHGAHHQH